MELCKMIFTLTILLLACAVLAQRRVGDRCIEKYHNAIGRCTPAHRCLSARNDLFQRKITPTLCNTDYDIPVICCRDSSGSAQNRISSTSNRGSGKLVSERKCEEYSKAVTQNVQFMSLLPEPETYSRAAPNCTYTSVELIVGGEDAVRGEFPHMAAIGWLDFDGAYVFNCGGSLISSRFVLTAGHCTSSPRAREPAPSVVRLGEHNVDPDVDDGADPIDVPIKAIHKHPDYSPPLLYNDIALLELEPVRFSTFVRPACLWNAFRYGHHAKVIATGWGVNDTTKETRVSALQKVSLSLLSNDYCDPLLVPIRSRKWQGFRDSQMCAGELRGNKDTCQGDSGSPLQVASSENQCIFHIVGIVSFGQRCANGRPAVYTRVYSYLDWIEGIVWPDE